jgi:acyl-CoA synthetase (AMP-forming)/AMP-acid ligase II
VDISQFGGFAVLDPGRDGGVGCGQQPCTWHASAPHRRRQSRSNARSFTPDGWYRSGDICRMTPGGNLIVGGRDKDMI